MNTLKLFSVSTLVLILSMLSFSAQADAFGFSKEKFQKQFYFSKAGSGSHSALSSGNAATMVDNASLWTIPAGTLIEKVYVVIDTAITGTTDIDVGDDDDADGYVDGSLSLTLATPQVYGWNAKLAGAYLRVQTAGVTDAADIYVVPGSKFYTVGTKKIAIDFTGTATAGALRVVIEGSNLGS